MNELTKLAIENQIDQCTERIQQIDANIRHGKHHLSKDEEDLLQFLIAKAELEALLNG